MPITKKSKLTKEIMVEAFNSVMKNLGKEQGEMCSSMDIFERCWSLYEHPALLASIVMFIADMEVKRDPAAQLISALTGEQGQAKFIAQARVQVSAGLLKWGNFVDEDRALIREDLILMCCGLMQPDGTLTTDGPDTELNRIVKKLVPDVKRKCNDDIQECMDGMRDKRPTVEEARAERKECNCPRCTARKLEI